MARCVDALVRSSRLFMRRPSAVLGRREHGCGGRGRPTAKSGELPHVVVRATLELCYGLPPPSAARLMNSAE
jgi:hypothetical protein